jgi:hypothetical protein
MLSLILDHRHKLVISLSFICNEQGEGYDKLKIKILRV